MHCNSFKALLPLSYVWIRSTCFFLFALDPENYIDGPADGWYLLYAQEFTFFSSVNYPSWCRTGLLAIHCPFCSNFSITVNTMLWSCFESTESYITEGCIIMLFLLEEAQWISHYFLQPHRSAHWSSSAKEFPEMPVNMSTLPFHSRNSVNSYSWVGFSLCREHLSSV